MANKLKSDLAAVRKRSADDIRSAAQGDPDAQPVTREMFAKAAPWGSFTPKIIKKKDVHICLDEDVIEYFKKQTGGKRGYQTLINTVLRHFMEHQA